MAAFAERAQEGRFRYEFKPGPYSSHTLLLESLPRQGGGLRVLDVGCADGYLGDILAARGYSVVGVDRPDPHRTNFPAAVELVERDLDQGLNLAGKFDYVICADVLEHLREPAALLGEVKTLLAPGGALVASLPNSGNAYFRLTILAGRFPAHDKGLFDRTHLHFYTWNGWVDLFAKAGFRITRAAPAGIPVGLAFPRWDRSLAIRAAERLCFDLARIWGRMFAYQFVVTASGESAR